MVVKSIIATCQRLVKRKSVMLALAVPLIALMILAMLYWRVDVRSRVDDARRADAIIVLGSAVWSGGRPSPSLAARAQHAIELYQAGYAPYLILCGGLGGNPPSEAEAMRRLAISAGVPENALILEDQSHSTEENLANAKKLMDARGLTTAIIVSDPFHILRAEIIARDLGMQVFGSGASVSPMYTRQPMHSWYTAREAIAIVWYYATRVIGEPTWLYGILKGKI